MATKGVPKPSRETARPFAIEIKGLGLRDQSWTYLNSFAAKARRDYSLAVWRTRLKGKAKVRPVESIDGCAYTYSEPSY